ncbi:hypothetical protein Hanom_Chr14g01335391 [Helianthus anomalus]
MIHQDLPCKNTHKINHHCIKHNHLKMHSSSHHSIENKGIHTIICNLERRNSFCSFPVSLHNIRCLNITQEVPTVTQAISIPSVSGSSTAIGNPTCISIWNPKKSPRVRNDSSCRSSMTVTHKKTKVTGTVSPWIPFFFFFFFFFLVHQRWNT